MAEIRRFDPILKLRRYLHLLWEEGPNAQSANVKAPALEEAIRYIRRRHRDALETIILPTTRPKEHNNDHTYLLHRLKMPLFDPYGSKLQIVDFALQRCRVTHDYVFHARIEPSRPEFVWALNRALHSPVIRQHYQELPNEIGDGLFQEVEFSLVGNGQYALAHVEMIHSYSSRYARSLDALLEVLGSGKLPSLPRTSAREAGRLGKS